MLTFEYEAKNAKTGEKIKATLQADSEASAAKLIREQSLVPLDIRAVGSGGFTFLGKFRNRISVKDKILFSRQMSTLINAGLPLVQSLRQVDEQTDNKAFKVVIGKIITDVEGGLAFSKALAKHPEVFNNIYINLIEAGEVSGTLDMALSRIATQQEKDADIISKVRGAMAYPAIVMLVMIGVLGFMIVKVLPQVEVIYRDLPGAHLPLLTVVLLSISHFTIKYWWLMLILLGLAIFATTRYARTVGGKQVIDLWKMKAWPMGPLFMKVYMARFSRTGTTLVASGVPLIKVLEVVAGAINNVHVEASINKAIEKVKGGKSLSESLTGDPNFLTLVPNMLKIGEQSGALEDMMEKTADYYEKEVDNQIKTISTIIEPMMMVVLGISAFIIVAAVLLPIYGLAGQNIIK
ncbi:hypothetical protein A3F37_04035 [Candidatus Saccharibacteria bacterium RIFCSPHIGHO2_12_FULL_41_12]|nr:MAG: hypothetical protein A3F37_04035 [Candidatus Saccharibacteria bacterium RIFCSPHIGHO2_12_FULL_41_12]